MATKIVLPYVEAVEFTEDNLEEVLDFIGLTQNEVNSDGNIEYQYDDPDNPTVIEVGKWVIGHPLRGPGQVEAIDASLYQKRYVEFE